MARTAKPTRATKAPATKRPRGRPPGSKNKVKATANVSAAPTRRAAASKRAAATPPKSIAAVSRAPVVTKDELRAQVEKLERANATLRTKNREAGREAKKAAARIEALEAQITKLERRAAVPKEAPARTRAARSKTVTPKPKPARSTRERRPSGSVPPGVAVQEPEPMDAEAETALENIEKHLSADETGAEGEE